MFKNITNCVHLDAHLLGITFSTVNTNPNKIKHNFIIAIHLIVQNNMINNQLIE